MLNLKTESKTYWSVIWCFFWVCILYIRLFSLLLTAVVDNQHLAHRKLREQLDLCMCIKYGADNCLCLHLTVCFIAVISQSISPALASLLIKPLLSLGIHSCVWLCDWFVSYNFS